VNRVEIRKLGGLRQIIALLSSEDEEVQRDAVLAVNRINERA